ncbi:hypothetical protein ExPCM14_02051 [Escherichia coli]|nr:hypothetical protein ExPCM14_02051 [Escherichia coli]
MLFEGFAPQFNQSFTNERVFQAVSAVEIPGVTCATRAAARFMIWQVRASARVVGLLDFPGHQTIFNVDFPATGACTVNTVGGTHDFVELPTLAIAVLPVAVAMHHLSVTIGKGFALLFEVAKAIQKFTHDITPAPGMNWDLMPCRMRHGCSLIRRVRHRSLIFG